MKNFNQADLLYQMLKDIGIESAPLVDDEEIPALPFVVYSQTVVAERQLADYSFAPATTFELTLYTETYAEGWERLSAIVDALTKLAEAFSGNRYVGLDTFGDNDTWRPEGSEKTGFTFTLTFTIS